MDEDYLNKMIDVSLLHNKNNNNTGLLCSTNRRGSPEKRTNMSSRLFYGRNSFLPILSWDLKLVEKKCYILNSHEESV